METNAKIYIYIISFTNLPIINSKQSFSIWHCMNRASPCNMYITNKMRNFGGKFYFIFNIRSTCFGLYQSVFRSSLFISLIRIPNTTYSL